MTLFDVAALALCSLIFVPLMCSTLLLAWLSARRRG